MANHTIICDDVSFRGILAVMKIYIETFYPNYIFSIKEELYNIVRPFIGGCVYHTTGEVCFSFSVHRICEETHMIIFSQFDSFFCVFEKIASYIKSILCEMLDATPKTQETLLLMAIKSPDSTMKSFTCNVLFDRQLIGSILEFI
jgi:hypothetical protein